MNSRELKLRATAFRHHAEGTVPKRVNQILILQPGVILMPAKSLLIALFATSFTARF